MNDHGQPVLYAIVTGSPAARGIGKLVELARGDGWDVCVIASPHGYRFIDADTLAAKTGHPVRHQYKEPDAPDVLPPADAMVVAPITCNSLAKWAAGISDTLPLGLLVEAVGKRQAVVAMPFSNREQISFPAPVGRPGGARAAGRQREPARATTVSSPSLSASLGRQQCSQG